MFGAPTKLVDEFAHWQWVPLPLSSHLTCPLSSLFLLFCLSRRLNLIDLKRDKILSRRFFFKKKHNHRDKYERKERE